MAEHGIIYTRLMNCTEWRKIRERQLYKQPWCEECQRHGVVRSAEVVHHVVEVETGRTEQEQRELAYSESNLQSLCRKHHNALHAEMKSHSRKVHKERTEARLAAWIAAQKGDGNENANAN